MLDIFTLLDGKSHGFYYFFDVSLLPIKLISFGRICAASLELGFLVNFIVFQKHSSDYTFIHDVYFTILFTGTLPTFIADEVLCILLSSLWTLFSYFTNYFVA